MSRFFATGDSSSSESESEEEEQDTGPGQLGKGAKMFMKDSDSEEDTGKRVVKSQKDKRWEAMQNTIADCKNHMKINDWNAIQNDFENINKQLAKANTIVQKEGIPKFYFKALIMLEDFLTKTLADKDSKKKMSTTNAKSLNSMKQKLRKHNKQYEEKLEEVRAAPDSGSDDDSDAWDPDADSEEEEDEKPAAKEEKPKAAKKKAAKDDDDSEEWDESSEDDSDDDGPVTGGGASRWLKKDTGKKPAEEKKDEKKDKKDKPKEAKGKVAKGDDKAKAKTVAEFNEADVDKKLDELLQQRGRKGTDRMAQIGQLQELAKVTKRMAKKVELLMHLIVSYFDINNNMLVPMPIAHWTNCYKGFREVLTVLNENPDVKVDMIEGATSVIDMLQMTKADEEELEEVATTGTTQVTGNVLAFLERLDDEFNKSLQLLDPHTSEYVQRLKDETILVQLMEDMMKYYAQEHVDNKAAGARVAARVVEHLSYKSQTTFESSRKEAAKFKLELEANVKAAEEALESAKGEEEMAAKKAALEAAKAADEVFVVPPEINLKDRMEDLATRIYGDGDERAKTRTLLCHVYHHALHSRFHEARDMMLMSHLQDTIQHSDVNTQILYNRAMVRLGLCAFHHGLLQDASNCLSEICSGARLKELLAQGVSNRYNDKNVEQEKAEKRRQVPYHMHINLELIEAVHLTCAMLLELPHLAQNAHDPKRRQMMSKNFRRLLDHFERQVFTGPPENTRDHVMTGAQAIIEGDWLKCADGITSLTIWNLMPDPEHMRKLIRTKLQQEGLRAFLLSYSGHYDSISLEHLATAYQLDMNTAHSIISKMIVSEELHASWDQPTKAIVMHKVEPSRLQYLALQFADKAAQFVEQNERLLDSRTGGYGYKFEQKQYAGKERWGGQGGYQAGGGPARSATASENPFS